MTRDEYIQEANKKATGEDAAPETDSESYNILLAQVKTLTLEWQNAVDEQQHPINWNSLWNRQTIGTVTVGRSTTIATPTLALIRKLSKEDDGFSLEDGSGGCRYFSVVKPNELKIGTDRVALVKNKLIFADPFAADDTWVGKNIEAAFYGYADIPAIGTDLISVDDPMWMVYRGAAELARNDFIKSGEYTNLLNLANERFDAMIANNRETSNNTIDHGDWSPGYGAV